MSEHKTKEIKEKARGTVEETVGKITDNKQLEVKGKVRQGAGKAYEIADEYQQKAANVKDTMVGATKEKVGELTGDQSLELSGKIQRKNADNSITKKLFYALGAIILALFLFNRRKTDE